jgi:hypothetical protein
VLGRDGGGGGGVTEGGGGVTDGRGGSVTHGGSGSITDGGSPDNTGVGGGHEGGEDQYLRLKKQSKICLNNSTHYYLYLKLVTHFNHAKYLLYIYTECTQKNGAVSLYSPLKPHYSFVYDLYIYVIINVATHMYL